MAEPIASILWKRLDVEGHDACRLSRTEDGFELSGHAVFDEGGGVCCLSYLVQCDGGWLTRRAQVAGFVGLADFACEIERLAGGAWAVNGVVQPEAQGQLDIDLNFTPATNLVAIRRLGMERRADTQAPAAWLTFPEPRLTRLDQTYRRLDDTRIAYRGSGYEGVLEVAPAGFVLHYPTLWKAVAFAA